MFSDSVRLSEKLRRHLHARPVHEKRIEQVTETYHRSFLHFSRLIKPRLSFPPSWFNYARAANYSQKMSTWVKFIKATDLFS